MTKEDEENIKRWIDEAVERALKERKPSGIIYAEISHRLFWYYQGKDDSMAIPVERMSKDKLWSIIPMYYRDNMTIEMIAKNLGVDISTVVRNKKRICLELAKVKEER